MAKPFELLKFKPRRHEGSHWMTTGELILLASFEDSKPEERGLVSDSARRFSERFASQMTRVPETLGWLGDALKNRKPLLELSIFEGRHYSNIRFCHPNRDLDGPCFGCTGPEEGQVSSVPELDWLMQTFGTLNLCAEWSGTAPLGRTFSELERLHPWFCCGGDEPEELPAEAAEWRALYEVDGDFVFFNPKVDEEVIWYGNEKTGEMLTRLKVPWRRALNYVVWRILDAGFVEPIDLRMLSV